MITANPDIKKIENKNLDFILIGCDGIWEEKTNEEMLIWIQERLKK
jgi:serine/threonine protein phosphatase PrpC